MTRLRIASIADAMAHAAELTTARDVRWADA